MQGIGYGSTVGMAQALGTAAALGVASDSPALCVSWAPPQSRPNYDPSMEETNDCFCVLSLGVPLKYVIPSFDLLAVEIRHMSVKGYNKDGEEEYFIRNDPSLCRVYPVWMEATDVTLIEVGV